MRSYKGRQKVCKDFELKSYYLRSGRRRPFDGETTPKDRVNYFTKIRLMFVCKISVDVVER